MSNETYVRGTKTTRVKTARLVPGDRVLTADLDFKGQPLPTGRVRDAQTKTGAVVRTVDHLEHQRTAATGFYGRAGRTYDVVFTDNTRAVDLAPILTWHAV